MNNITQMIDGLNLDMILTQLTKKTTDNQNPWTKEEAETAIKWYKRFLIIHAKYHDAGPFAPSKMIDEVWHHHILFSKRYQSDCQKTFGYYLHHNPAGNTKGEKERLKILFKKTNKYFMIEFGEICNSKKGKLVLAGRCGSCLPSGCDDENPECGTLLCSSEQDYSTKNLA